MPKISIPYYTTNPEAIKQIKDNPYLSKEEKKIYISNMRKQAFRKTMSAWIGRILLIAFVMFLFWIGQLIANMLSQ